MSKHSCMCEDIVRADGGITAVRCLPRALDLGYHDGCVCEECLTVTLEYKDDSLG